ncbi:hypothetical protein Micbo1qcDRAFT_12627 [Microdochium bolleyi]|uniref:DUF7371 domain-containing protein n=1 Tax=Microdochium bolleyi TaxID=196109 RepID=A0A136IWX2_9PEZI|nr:hypothetical protein Micbo1qcDRAFT_12627 [Microdochium bolleyi]
MLSPYHRLWFSRSFNIKADARSTSPASPVLQFHPDLTSASNAGEAMISVGPQRANSCFSFDLYAANLGCASFYGGCHFKMTGARYDEATGREVDVATETFHIRGCKDIESCQLQPVAMSTLRGLTSITITAEADGLPATWWSDNLMLGWSDNSCESSVCRSAIRDSIRRRDWTAYRH